MLEPYNRRVSLLLLTHFAATWFLVGLIWTIQVVHYPLFARVGPDLFPGYQSSHSTLITIVVGPLMLLELLTGFFLLLTPPAPFPAWIWWVGMGLIGAIWLTTTFVSVPLHGRLSGGFEAKAYTALVGTNWIRTLAWTLRGLLLLWAFTLSH